jgi:hypothetical protein
MYSEAVDNSRDWPLVLVSSCLQLEQREGDGPTNVLERPKATLRARPKWIGLAGS